MYMKYDKVGRRTCHWYCGN